MTRIWKSRWGGYYSAENPRDRRDIQMVMVPTVKEIREHIDLMNPFPDQNPNNFQIELVLMALTGLTPDGTDKKAWRRIHGY